MSVTTESPRGDITSGRANESTSNFYYTSNNLKKKYNFSFENGRTLLSAGRNLISPGANAAFPAVSQTR
jgi:hypothetical protein